MWTLEEPKIVYFGDSFILVMKFGIIDWIKSQHQDYFKKSPSSPIMGLNLISSRSPILKIHIIPHQNIIPYTSPWKTLILPFCPTSAYLNVHFVMWDLQKLHYFLGIKFVFQSSKYELS